MQKSPIVHYFKDYRPSDFLIDQVFLHFDLHEEQTKVNAVLNVRRNPKVANAKAPLVLNGEALQLLSVSLDGHELDASDYTVDEGSLTIVNVPDKFTVETKVIIKPQENTKLSGLYKSRNNFCTQCEAQGFRRITYYLDRPDVMARFTTTISADKKKYPVLLSNGNLIETRDLDQNRHWVHWEDPSLKPCYLFALVAGDFDLLTDTFVTMTERQVALCLYVEKGYKDQGDYALASLKRAMRWDEERFGREYDLNIYMIVAVDDFNMGAMENKGLNIFNTKYILAKPETATDNDYVGIEGVIGHEYFHNWSGNRVTCRDWFQITLKEGLTVFRDQLFTEDMTSQAVARLDSVNVMRTHQFLEDAGPMAHPIRPDSYLEVNNFYTATVYRKGAEVIRMVQTLLTSEIFRKGMDLYFHRHDGQAVTTEEFIKAMEDASGKDLTQFRRWYGQAGTPVLDIHSEYDVAAKTYKLTVKQSCPPTPGQPKKEAFYLPLAMGFVGSHCRDMPTQLHNESQAFEGTRVLEIKKPVEEFIFVNVAEKPIPSLLRGFSAPVKLNYGYANKELAWLFQCDSDAFTRWNAGQQLAVNIISQLITLINQKRTLRLDPLFIETFEKLLTSGPDDLNFLSRLLTLPSESYLLANLVGIDVAVMHQAREFVKHELAIALETQIREIYEKNKSKIGYVYNAIEMGKRNIKNICLFYLLETSKHEYFELAYQQFKTVDNMTDTIGALIALNNHMCDERENALNEFYQRWHQEALVVNKWFSLHATSTLPGTLDKVRQLLRHPSFHIHNPNNVYSLIGGFGANISQFHDSGGAGYQFVADQVLAVDSLNPQVAARIIQPLTYWKQVDDRRASLMRTELSRIAKAPKLSRDIYEIVEKSVMG